MGNVYLARDVALGIGNRPYGKTPVEHMLPPGRYRGTATLPNGKFRAFEIEVVAGQTRTAALHLQNLLTVD